MTKPTFCLAAKKKRFAVCIGLDISTSDDRVGGFYTCASAVADGTRVDSRI